MRWPARLSLSILALLTLGAAACACAGDPIAAAKPDVAAGDALPDTPVDPGDAADGAAPDLPQRPPPNLDRDLRHMDLTLDLAAMQGLARIRLGTSATASASFEAAGLFIASVRLGAVDLLFAHHDGLLDVSVPSDVFEPVIEVRYSFKPVPATVFEGYMASGSTLLWPDHCGNLFPCHSAPHDGLTFTLKVEGLKAGQVAVHAPDMAAEVPSYAVAFAVGDYAWTSLGKTAAGTEIGFYSPAVTLPHLTEGTAQLRAHFDWLEKTLGPYAFGKRAGPVAVDWGLFAAGGIEHHPYWHVSIPALADPLVHVHEAAHGWFGTSIRLLCWEDLVLSEGLATYLAARAVDVVQGQAAGDKVWAGYQTELQQLVGAGKDMVVWPDSCGVVDVMADGLFSRVTYMKGALFLRALSAQTGPAKLDQALGSFYAQFAGQPARMADLLSHLHKATGVDPTPLAQAWLRAKGIPGK